MLPFVPDGRSHYVAEWRSFWSIPARIRHKSFACYMIASFDSLVFSLLSARRNGSEVETFDDGTMSLTAREVEPRLQNEPPLHRWTKRLMRAWSTRAIVERAKRHFTIYPPEHLVLGRDRAVSVPLVEKETGPKRSGVAIRVMLGMPIDFHGGRESPRIKSEYCRYEALPCDIFLAHPAEHIRSEVRSDRLQDRDHWSTAANTLIAEDLLLRLLCCGYHVEVVGISSSALINVASFARATNVVIAGVNDHDAPLYATFGVPTATVADREALG